MSESNNLEAKIKQVDAILARIESGEVPLAEVAAEYKKAAELTAEIETGLNELENEIEIVAKDFAE